MNWKRIFQRYNLIVGIHEGVDFLYEDEWSLGDWKAIEEALKESPESTVKAFDQMHKEV